MSISADIYTILNGDLGLTLYPDELPQDVTYPACTYEVDSGDFMETFDGDQSLDRYTVTVTVYAKTRSQCETIATSIRTNYHGATRAAIAALGTGGTYSAIFVDFGTSYTNIETKTYSQEVTLELIKTA